MQLKIGRISIDIYNMLTRNVFYWVGILLNNGAFCFQTYVFKCEACSVGYLAGKLESYNFTGQASQPKNIITDHQPFKLGVL